MKKLLSLLLALTMLLTLTVYGSAEEAEEAEVVTLVMAETDSSGSVVGEMNTFFKRRVEELSGGSLKIDIQADGALGTEEEVLDSVMSGSDQIDMACISAFALNPYGVQKTVFCTLPFVFESPDHFCDFAGSELADEFLNEPQELGLPVRGLYFGERGFRNFFTKEPVQSVEDLAGLQLRVPDDPVLNGLVEGLGASPTEIPFDELYAGLEAGECDGAEQSIGVYKDSAFNQVAPYLILDGHTPDAVQVIITDNAWNKLTEEQQGWIMQIAEFMQSYNLGYIESSESKALRELEEAGVTVIEVEDKEPLAEAVADLLEPYTTGEMGQIYDQIEAMK